MCSRFPAFRCFKERRDGHLSSMVAEGLHLYTSAGTTVGKQVGQSKVIGKGTGVGCVLVGEPSLGGRLPVFGAVSPLCWYCIPVKHSHYCSGLSSPPGIHICPALCSMVCWTLISSALTTLCGSTSRNHGHLVQVCISSPPKCRCELLIASMFPHVVGPVAKVCMKNPHRYTEGASWTKE